MPDPDSRCTHPGWPPPGTGPPGNRRHRAHDRAPIRARADELNLHCVNSTSSRKAGSPVVHETANLVVITSGCEV